CYKNRSDSSSDNNNNTEQHCKGCDKDHPCSLFIDNNKTFRTCNLCRTQDKKNKNKKHPKEHNNKIIVDFHDFYNHILTHSK
ncbi:6702_t:CDS:1, partial [Dentiscutata erythropus]